VNKEQGYCNGGIIWKQHVGGISVNYDDWKTESPEDERARLEARANRRRYGRRWREFSAEERAEREQEQKLLDIERNLE
jgi:hypothetical protein